MATSITPESDYNRSNELKAFDETKAGVKGLVDSGQLTVPRIFIRPSHDLDDMSSSDTSHFKVPVIDLHGIQENRNLRHKAVDEIKSAAEKWGFFQVVNHGMPLNVLSEMIQGVIRFNEQDDEVKKVYYSRDRNKRVRFNSIFDLYTSKAANWRDTLSLTMSTPDPIDPDQLPHTCRNISLEYTKQVTKLGDTLFLLLSECLGLKSDHLQAMQCNETCSLVCHYYPACPEPELTLGTSKHTDPVFLTILLQDHIGGLQVLHQDNWGDVAPIPGSLVINIGDLLQITSNNKLKSVEHRVLANHGGPRVSVACFLTARFDTTAKTIGPIKELVSDDSERVYKDITMKEYLDHFYHQGLQQISGLDMFKV